MSNIFPLLLSPFEAIAENNTTYNYLTERHLQAIWFEQKYFKDLKTSDGKDIEILSPGIWNGDAGPDFLKAHIRINGRELQGDIEIHLADEGWMQHGHSIDPRYNQVVLHISLWESIKPKILQKQNGELIPKTYLDPSLTIPHAQIVNLIDLDLYPYRKFIGSGKCAHQLFKSLPEEKIDSLFSSAALYRLTRKYDHLATQTGSKELILGGGVAMALGYKHNAQAFLELFLTLINQNDRDESSLFTQALGLTGFFETKHLQRWESSELYRSLQKSWGDDIEYKLFNLVLNQIRPYNHPVRRLAYLAKWIANSNYQEIEQNLQEVWSSNYPFCHTQKGWRGLFITIIELIPSYEDPYWNHHYTFESRAHEKNLPLIGKDLKEEIAVNTLLPILYYAIKSRNNIDELEAFNAFYKVIPTTQSGKSRYLTHRFFGESPKGQFLKRRKLEQGAFQLHRDFCIHFEASCEGCPFVERYKLIEKN